MVNYINKLKNDKKGYSVVNVIICVLVILLTFSLLIEITLIGQRYSYISQTASYVARIVGEQGGIRSSVPSGYSEPTYYTKSSNLYNTLSNGFNTAGFDSWTVKINGVRLRSSTNISIPEKEEVHVEIEAGFYPVFDFMGNSSRLVKIQTDRLIYSSFTPRTGSVDVLK